MKAAAVAVAVALVGAAATARAAADYAADSREWNGLARLGDEAAAAGCTLAPTPVLDWSALEARDALWIVYPRTLVDGGKLRRFLEAGGRAVVADDFGASDAALAALDIRRLRGELDDAAHYQDNPGLPVARQALQTELSVGVPDLVANHPAFFSSPNPPTYAFVPGAALVVEGRLGKGYFVALADPSVLINNMLEIDDDLAFARALIRRTCKPGERIVLVTQSFVARGEPPGELVAAAGDSPFSRFNRMLESIDDAIQAAADGRALGGLALGFGLVALGLLVRAWPGRTRIDGHWTRAAAVDGGLQALVDRYGGAEVPWGWALPAAALRDEVVTRLSEALGAPVADWSPAELGRRVARARGPHAGALAAELWKRLRRLGWRGGQPAAEPWVTRRQLERLHDGARALFDALAPGGQGND